MKEIFGSVFAVTDLYKAHKTLESYLCILQVFVIPKPHSAVRSDDLRVGKHTDGKGRILMVLEKSVPLNRAGVTHCVNHNDLARMLVQSTETVGYKNVCLGLRAGEDNGIYRFDPFGINKATQEFLIAQNVAVIRYYSKIKSALVFYRFEHIIGRFSDTLSKGFSAMIHGGMYVHVSAVVI